MHREIQIKQFPIVTTHWWPKTRNERFVWENEQYLYSFFYLLYTTMSKWSECAHASGVWRVRARSGSLCIHTGRRHRRQRLTEGVSEAWCWRAVIVTTTNHILLWCCMNSIGYLHEAIWLADASVGAWKVVHAVFNIQPFFFISRPIICDIHFVTGIPLFAFTFKFTILVSRFTRKDNCLFCLYLYTFHFLRLKQKMDSLLFLI